MKTLLLAGLAPVAFVVALAAGPTRLSAQTAPQPAPSAPFTQPGEGDRPTVLPPPTSGSSGVIMPPSGGKGDPMAKAPPTANPDRMPSAMPPAPVPGTTARPPGTQPIPK